MRVCSKCSAAVEEDARFCSHCGAAVAESDSITCSAPPTCSATEPLSTAASTSHGRFEPGAKLGKRYRIVALLGRGGMGEVYRADDLELGQSVALKFLPTRVAGDPQALARFRNEVRTARQIAHPNVCRMFDIGQDDGHVFLSMEYVDGEDLAHVLRRMGRPSSEKALEIARQLCLGLAAAHENGVLHRDLKPANIMIDGRGRVRITDFGLAGLADELTAHEERAGTPAYMAPEQLYHGSASVRSDIYALGLILHEVFTGRKVFDTNNIADLQRQHQTGTVSLATSGTETLDPAAERVVLRCLEHDPQRRPSSVYAVLGALPGGDPLAAALAAGETPSPELLAEGGESGGLAPRTALALLATTLALIGLLVWLAPQKSLIGYVSRIKPEAELALRARDLFKEVTAEDPPEYEASGFTPNQAYTDEISKTDESADRWDRLRNPRPPPLTFWQRFSSIDLTPAGLHATLVQRDNPALAGPGSALIEFDPQGRLVTLEIIPHRQLRPPPEVPIDAVDTLFKHAGLERAQFDAVESRFAPPVPCDSVQAFSGPYGVKTDKPATVLVGTFRGRPNYFEILNSWQQAEPSPPPPMIAIVIVGVVLLVVVNLIAYRNLAQNRCDRRGAFRLAVFTLLIWMGAWAIGELQLRGSPNHVFTQIGYMLFGKPFGHAFAHAFIAWIAYIALEPYARRLWPRTLVTWTRLLMGRVRDPQLGRDILVGALFGCGLVVLDHLTRYIGIHAGAAPQVPTLVAVGGLRQALSLVVALAGDTVSIPLVMLVVLVVLRLLLRSNRAAIVGFVLLQTGIGLLNTENSLNPGFLVNAISIATFATLLVLMLLRFGACAGVAAFWVQTCLDRLAVTPDLTQWYAPSALVGVLTCVALVCFAFHTSLAGQPIFRDTLGERQPGA